MSKEKKLLIISGIVVLVICVGSMILGAIFVFGAALFVRTPTVGPTFTSPEALAYDLVYETTYSVALPDSIQPLLSQSTDGDETYTAVLTTYDTAEGQQSRLVVARANVLGRDSVEYFVQNMTLGTTWQNDDFTAQTAFYEHGLDTETAVYGQVTNPDVAAIQITWENWQDEAQLAYAEDGTPIAYLWFQTWSPVDGSPQPVAVTAVDIDGNIIRSLP